MENQGRVAFLRTQVRIARAHGQAIGLTHNWADDDFDEEIQVAHHTAVNRALGSVFLSEESQVWFNDVEEFRHYRSDSAKMPWARLAAQHFAHTLNRQVSNGIFRIHVFDRRRKQNVDPLALQQFTVPLESAGIFGQVFIGSELQGIYKDGNYD